MLNQTSCTEKNKDAMDDEDIAKLKADLKGEGLLDDDATDAVVRKLAERMGCWLTVASKRQRRQKA